MKKYLKVSLILIIILTVYSIFVFLISKKEEEKPTVPPVDKEPINKVDIPEEKTADYNIVLTPNTIISYIDGSWIENKNLEYANMSFDVYANSESYGKKFLTYNKEWYIYDENRNFSDYTGELFAINTSKQYKVMTYNESILNDDDKVIISTLLDNKQITYNYDNIIKSKVVYDVNKDGIREEIFLITNAFTENINEFNHSFSIGFVRFHNKTEIFYENISDIYSSISICSPYLQNLIELDDQIHFIVGCTYFSTKGTEHYLYSVANNLITEEIKTTLKK